MVDSEEQGNSIEAILEIAQLSHCPVAEVREIYEPELARLKSDARIMSYVPLFASRRTRAHLTRIASEERVRNVLGRRFSLGAWNFS